MQENNQANPFTKKKDVSISDFVAAFIKWYRILHSKKRTLLLFVIIGLISGILYSLITKPRYKAEVVFVIENTLKSGASSYSSIAAQFGLSLGSGGGGLFQEDENLISFLKSRTMIAKTLLSPSDHHGHSELLIDRYLELKNYRDDWKKNKDLSNISFPDDPEKTTILQDSIINLVVKNILDDNLSVNKPDKKTDIIVLSTVATDQKFAKEFTEKLLENVTTSYIKSQTKKSEENVSILQYQVDSVRTLLNTALSGVASSTDANPNPNPAFQRLRVPSQKRLVDVELNRAILQELVKNLELAKITLRKETPLVQIIDKPVLPLQKHKVGILKGLVLGGMLFFFIGAVLIISNHYYMLFKLRLAKNSEAEIE